MNIADETPDNGKDRNSPDSAQKECSPGPAEKEIKEFEEYLMDIGIRI